LVRKLAGGTAGQLAGSEPCDKGGLGLLSERPHGIPAIRDRVSQTAAKIVIEPVFEADFEDNAYGYRPAGDGVKLRAT
jgi:hypothetical protein